MTEPLDLEPIKAQLKQLRALEITERATGRASCEQLDLEDGVGHYQDTLERLIAEIERLRAPALLLGER